MSPYRQISHSTLPRYKTATAISGIPQDFETMQALISIPELCEIAIHNYSTMGISTRTFLSDETEKRPCPVRRGHRCSRCMNTLLRNKSNYPWIWLHLFSLIFIAKPHRSDRNRLSSKHILVSLFTEVPFWPLSNEIALLSA